MPKSAVRFVANHDCRLCIYLVRFNNCRIFYIWQTVIIYFFSVTSILGPLTTGWGESRETKQTAFLFYFLWQSIDREIKFPFFYFLYNLFVDTFYFFRNRRSIGFSFVYLLFFTIDLRTLIFFSRVSDNLFFYLTDYLHRFILCL
jgi:hypothetical protein